MTEPLKVKTSRDGQILRWTLARADRRNAIDDRMIDELVEAASKIPTDSSTRVVLLEGEGTSFCAGADIDSMRQLGECDEQDNRAAALRMAKLFAALDTLQKPLVGRLHGHCFGGGVGLAAVCDIVVAEESCVFSTSEVRLGIIPAVVGPYLVQKMGLSRCRELILSARRFSCTEAQIFGLVHHVTDKDSLDKVVDTVLNDLLLGGPRAQEHVKSFLRKLGDGDRTREKWAEWTAAEIARARASREGQQGLEAFLNKTPPPWVPEVTNDK